MTERKAVYYGEVELIPGIICDGYVLDNETAVMSERGTASILGMARQSLNNMSAKWPPKYLEPFIDNSLNMSANLVEVIAQKSHYKGRKITVYTTAMVENLISGYALAFANDCLRKNQRHIGKRAVTFIKALVRTTLDTAIKEACGFLPEIQKTAQKHYIDAARLIQEFGFICSVPNDIATKKEKERERAIAEEYALIRFHQRISLEVLFNAILRVQPGKIIKLYDVEQTNQDLHRKYTKN